MLKSEENISVVINTVKELEFTPSRLYTPIYTVAPPFPRFSLIITSPFPPLWGFAVAAIAALTLQRAPWQKYQGTEISARACDFPVPGAAALPRTQPGQTLAGSKQAAAPKTGGEQLLPRATFLSQIISTLHWNSCNLWPEIFWKHLEGLPAFVDAQTGCKNFGMPRRIASIFGSWEEVLRSSRGSGAFVGNTEPLQTVESLGFFVGSFKGASRWAVRRLT